MNKSSANTVLFVILEQFTDYEYAFLAAALNGGIQDKSSPYSVKTVSVGKSPIKSIGGFTVVPDYSVNDAPEDFAAVVLIGGLSWRTEDAKKILPLVNRAVSNGNPLAAICDSTVFLAANGFLNGKKHTGNSIDDLRAFGGENYTGAEFYQNEQAVRDGDLITANGSAALEFTRETLTALDAYPADYIESSYQFFKLGFLEFMKNPA